MSNAIVKEYYASLIFSTSIFSYLNITCNEVPDAILVSKSKTIL